MNVVQFDEKSFFHFLMFDFPEKNSLYQTRIAQTLWAQFFTSLKADLWQAGTTLMEHFLKGSSVQRIWQFNP